MKYSKEQKLRWAKAYREGKLDHSMAPAGVKYKNFLTMVRRWEKLSTLHGDDAVTAGHRKRKYPAAYKLRAVARVQAGESAGEVARALGITSNSVVQQWVETYRLLGAKGLESKPKGRRPKNMPKKKKNCTRDEELEYLRAENAYLKKYMELLGKHGMVPVSSESKQKPSKSSGKKATD